MILKKHFMILNTIFMILNGKLMIIWYIQVTNTGCPAMLDSAATFLIGLQFMYEDHLIENVDYSIEK